LYGKEIYLLYFLLYATEKKRFFLSIKINLRNELFHQIGGTKKNHSLVSGTLKVNFEMIIHKAWAKSLGTSIFTWIYPIFPLLSEKEQSNLSRFYYSSVMWCHTCLDISYWVIPHLSGYFLSFFFWDYSLRHSYIYIWVNCARIVPFEEKKSKKIKVDLKEIWVVQSIELCQLCINIVFSQLSVFPFRKKSSFIIKCMFFMIFCHGKMYVFFQFLDKRNFTGVFIYWYYISIESSWKGESN